MIIVNFIINDVLNFLVVIVVDLLVYFPATFLYAANQNLMSEVDKVI